MWIHLQICILERSKCVQEFWLVSSEDPSVVIFTAQSRHHAYQQLAFVEQIQILVADGQIMYVVGGSLVLYISFAPLESLALPEASHACKRAANVLPAPRM